MAKEKVLLKVFSMKELNNYVNSDDEDRFS